MLGRPGLAIVMVHHTTVTEICVETRCFHVMLGGQATAVHTSSALSQRMHLKVCTSKFWPEGALQAPETDAIVSSLHVACD